MRSPLWLSALIVLSACGGISGSGKIVTREREIGPFRTVSVASGIRLTGVPGARALTVTADDNIVTLVETVVEAQTLHVRLAPDTWLASGVSIVAFVDNDVFEGVEASGGSHVKLSPTAIDTLPLALSGGSEAELTGISSRRIEAELSGGSALTLSGNAVDGQLEASGGSAAHLEGVCLETLDVRASGGSEISARVMATLTGSASGGTTVTVVGMPANQMTTSGGSEVSLKGP